MGLLGRILGIERGDDRRSEVRRAASPQAQAEPAADAPALERYRYMVQTAPPETIEQAHAEAFARLTPDQRRQVLAELANAAPEHERESARGVSPDDPRAMGRLATRTELRQPGFMERTLGGAGGGFGGSLLGSFAMGFVGSMVANSFFSALGGMGTDHAADTSAGDSTDTASSTDDYGDDFGDDFGGGDFDV